MRQFALLLLLCSGCGLMLDSDDMPDSGGAYDGAMSDTGVPDAIDMDAPELDASSDTGMEIDAVSSDVMPIDGGTVDSTLPDVIPVIDRGLIELASLMVPAGETDARFQPYSFSPDLVKFQATTLMDRSVLNAALYGESGAISRVTVDGLDSSSNTWIRFLITDGLDDGWYCAYIHATPSTLGRVLDGEFTATFPSGDGAEGGDFAYMFGVLQGDVDRDRDVDGDDFLAAMRGDPAADLNGDGVVDSVDRTIVNGAFGNILDSASASTVCPATPAATP